MRCTPCTRIFGTLSSHTADKKVPSFFTHLVLERPAEVSLRYARSIGLKSLYQEHPYWQPGSPFALPAFRNRSALALETQAATALLLAAEVTSNDCLSYSSCFR